MATGIENGPLQTVPYVDLERYLWKWYDIASFPQRFQKGCACTAATYSKNADGSIKVVNRCRVGGKEKVHTAKAKVKDKKANAKLSVCFFRPFTGKYWIIDPAGDYSYAAVGHPSRNYLWILSRQPLMDEAVYSGIPDRLRQTGMRYSPARRNAQDCG